MKLLDKYPDIDNVYNMARGLNKSLTMFNMEKNRYYKYKDGIIIGGNEIEKKSFEILSLLEQLGYPTDELGTYLFKHMIMRINDTINTWKEDGVELETKNLYKELSYRHSDFFKKISSEELGLSTMIFARSILYTSSLIDIEKVNKKLVNEIFENNYNPNNYQVMSIYIINYLRKKDKKDLNNNKLKR